MNRTARVPAFYRDQNRPCLGQDDLFFAPDAERNRKANWDSGPAKQVCFRCPHQTECGEWALSEGLLFGVWGGLDEDQRYKITKCRRGECGPKCAHMFRQKLGW